MGMPSLQKFVAAFDNHCSQSCQFLWTKTAGPSKFNGIKPELGRLFIAFHVDMRRLSVFEAVEEEPNSLRSKDRGHRALTG
jgi:hypothetical protein